MQILLVLPLVFLTVRSPVIVYKRIYGILNFGSVKVLKYMYVELAC